MKPVDFSYMRAHSVEQAIEQLATSQGTARIMSGGQTLGPMLNLRFVQPDAIVDVTRIARMRHADTAGAALLLGACTTHADVEDGRVPDVTRGMMQRVASGIAYRAVRTRGTIGGSLAHADPAADWVTCLTALDAQVSLQSPSGGRQLPLREFVLGPLTTALGPEDLVVGITVPALAANARWGYHKICRKTGEFAEAIGAVVIDAGRCRIIAGATSNRPVTIELNARELGSAAPALDDVKAMLSAAGLEADHYEMNIHAAAVRRAFQEALAR